MKTPDPQDRALVVVLPERICAQIDTWRQAYDPNHGIMPPHITVAYPPFVPEEQWRGLRRVVGQCLGGLGPFQVVLQGLGVFETDECVLWLRVEDGGELAQVRASLMHCLPQYVPPLPFEYVPHVTLGVFDSPSALKMAMLAMGDQLRPQRFAVRRLSYLSPDENGVWSVCRHVPLGIRNEE